MSRFDSTGYTPEKGRKSVVEHECGSCEVWVQLGRPPAVASLHSDSTKRHPGNERNATAFSAYLSRGS